ncbi:putative pentatricopeptide repeat-containing protein At5g08310, mitochondrial [Amborella trichopoda]|uniref:putative pentatricopeptide repeat-containing protein At5g08310, mitochondrial n=1 Tax=Amborella trichopoda TaxID=13333 RepID=UPI0005D39177|nr:putative pentatricopeptide repeat-containing protein At5g08310, mitochondrial [Amborella trichopoda]|eukprot:XP_011627973.1 putative pentatricopeptide repeat-containing protein At5g08310, mitochondrial [Amborella trichopoda]
MALHLKTIRFFSANSLFSFHLIPYFLHLHAGKTHEDQGGEPVPFPSIPKTPGPVETAVSLFSKPSFHRSGDELRKLQSFLTTETVEIILKGFQKWGQAYEFFLWIGQQDGYKHNCYTYNSMACILLRSGQRTPLKALVKDFMIQRCSMSPGALGYLIRRLGNVCLAEEANYVFERACDLTCEPNSYTFNCLLEALAKSKWCELVESRFKEMIHSGTEPDKFTHTAVLQAYCNSGKFDKRFDIFERIRGKGWVDPHVFTILIVGLSKLGEVDHAFEFVERMRGM